MPKRKTPELKPEEQFKRFVETAEELGVTNAAEIEKKFHQLSTPEKSSDARKSGSRSK